MNRYALFCGTYNLLMGGVKDFLESLETKEEAKEKAEQIAKDPFVDWVQIFDKKTDATTIYKVIDGKLVECEAGTQ
ncbi:hypothetical protein [Microbulbifer sp. 2205BS26-8]|uniref:hypothetical protein n=1 Tax=Microbulbifer sp. 2205BS26-8 TaxID=3064386 RepID=UPI00273F048F|nr:hypothetical protein [Microbulbifer sp. 2205BS26-8]MDP5210957.1 hypothetical protein [Microbulbifer sp. 2205BS26-8]MDP5210966.1 hypothetical protein [Microbulbifer sp. 2205BS26-8]